MHKAKQRINITRAWLPKECLKYCAYTLHILEVVDQSFFSSW